MTEWYMEGPWLKNCNCDPGCPCDFNQRPTHDYCAGMVAMRIDKGHFADVDLGGLVWGAMVRWPGALHEGNGEAQPFVSDSASDEQVGALFEILSGKQGDSLMEVLAVICPTVHEPVRAPVEFEFDIDSRNARVRVGDVLETDVETLRGINPPEPYRVVVRIPNGMEYTGENEEAETALAKRIVARGAVTFDVTDGHSSLAYVRHGNAFRTGRHEPTVVAR